MLSEELIFDVSTNQSITFEELMVRLNSEAFYYEKWCYTSFYDFLVNFLKALINGRDITLLDKDFSNEELAKLGYSNSILIKHTLASTSPNITDKASLINKLTNSKSSVTFFTSGTTGIPKRIIHTIPTLTRMIRVGNNYKDNVWAIAYNPTHIAGVQVILQALFNGNRMVYAFETSGNELKRSIIERGITHISATPTFYRLLVSEKTSFPAIKRITLGGEKSDARLHKLLSISFPNSKINNIYASTELGSLFVTDCENFVVPASLADKVQVMEDELMVHSSLLSWQIEDEWYKTGDLVQVINTFPLTFKFQSRKNEMINTGGYKVNPNEVEEAIRSFKEVREVRVFGKPNSVLGNILCAEIVFYPDNHLENNEIFSRLKNILQEFKIPRIIKVLDKIEVTRTGKLSRK
ncbi:MAG: AMP-binding protein [Prolixibacteraceae bacterium]|jgi:acyl-coenzyme A synthetase/AMP-(fatty) acid ligase|nr:AMP-binding protein [Prolixibacteraceae bacterium]